MPTTNKQRRPSIFTPITIATAINKYHHPFINKKKHLLVEGVLIYYWAVVFAVAMSMGHRQSEMIWVIDLAEGVAVGLV